MYKGSTVFTENEIFYFIAGIVINPDGNPRFVYSDSKNAQDFSIIDDSFRFSISPKDILVFENKK